jgi:hypothetical protein
MSRAAIVIPIFMKDPFELIPWALGIGIAWIILISLTGLDDWLKELFGKRRPDKELQAKLESLESRVAELEKKP